MESLRKSLVDPLLIVFGWNKSDSDSKTEATVHKHRRLLRHRRHRQGPGGSWRSSDSSRHRDGSGGCPRAAPAPCPPRSRPRSAGPACRERGGVRGLIWTCASNRKSRLGLGRNQGCTARLEEAIEIPGWDGGGSRVSLLTCRSRFEV